MEVKDVDAFQYLVSCLKPSPDGFKVIGYDVSLYEVCAEIFARAQHRGFQRPSAS